MKYQVLSSVLFRGGIQFSLNGEMLQHFFRGLIRGSVGGRGKFSGIVLALKRASLVSGSHPGGPSRTCTQTAEGNSANMSKAGSDTVLPFV